MSVLTLAAQNHGEAAPIGADAADASGTVPVLYVEIIQPGSYLVIAKGEIYNSDPNSIHTAQGSLYIVRRPPGVPGAPVGEPQVVGSPLDYAEVLLGQQESPGANDTGGSRQCITLVGKHESTGGDFIYLGFKTANGGVRRYSLYATLVDSMEGNWFTTNETPTPQNVPGYPDPPIIFPQ